MKKLAMQWQDLIKAPRSAFYGGSTKDSVFDRMHNTRFFPSTEALFTQSNVRVLLGHAANGTLRMAAMPTQVYPAPTQTSEFGLGPGMYHHFDVVMYAGNLSYKMTLDDGRIIDLEGDRRENKTFYAYHFMPVTTMREDGLEISTISFAPVAPNSLVTPLKPAPLPGPAGAFYVLNLHNSGSRVIEGSISLLANDLLIGHYEDAAVEKRAINIPSRHVRQETLVLCRPEGCVGIHFEQGKWSSIDVPFQAKLEFSLQPDEEKVFTTYIALGSKYEEIMPVIYGLYMRSTLEWLNLTVQFWNSRLGILRVSAPDTDNGEFSRDLYIRSIFDNLNCLQTDADGNLIAHWQGAPSHGYGTIWGIDVEPTAVSVVHLCPEVARQVMLFFIYRSRMPKGQPDHSVPILVAPIIIARQWLQVTGDVDYFEMRPAVLAALIGIADHLLTLKAPDVDLFPTRYSSDGAVGRRYDYGTNVKVYYALDSIAFILDQLGRKQEAENYYQVAARLREAMKDCMAENGPFGPQISGGTNLGEDPGRFYLPENVFYYDGEDTSSMLAPIYDACEYGDPVWWNYHRWARSIWNPGYDVEFDSLLWSPTEPAIIDGTGFFSRLGGSVTKEEMTTSLQVLRNNAVDEVTGSIYWWPHGLEYKRSLTRCSQGQGAWAWQYLEQWLGLKIDAVHRILVLAPRGLLSKIQWEGYASGSNIFDIFWEENDQQTTFKVTNRNKRPWTIKAGFRPYGSGAEGPVDWRNKQVLPGQQIEFVSGVMCASYEAGMAQAEIMSLETRYFGEEGLIFKRFGPAQLWGHWDTGKLWDKDAMPLALRFLVQNETGHDWCNVQVSVSCPASWRIQGRRPLHWDPADELSAHQAVISLGDLPDSSRIVAPFWLAAPEDASISMVWWNENIGPFHQTSQPGAGIRLFTNKPDICVTETFLAELSAQSQNGHTIVKVIEVPVRITTLPVT